MFGWFSAAMARASRSNRSENDSPEILIATSRRAGVIRAIDLSHTAGAERAGDLVRSKPRTRVKGHSVVLK